MTRRTILVTGATGRVGRQLVAQLLDAGAEVRALVRDPTTARLPAGVDLVTGALDAPGGLPPAALDGADAAFLLWPGLPAELAAPVVDQIAGRVGRVVYLSANLPDETPEEGSIAAFHLALERLIRASGARFTFLRAGGFAGNTLGWAADIRADGVVRSFHGRAGRSLIHERDIAAVAVRALTEDGHDGESYVLTGPQVLTQAEMAGIIGDVIGRPVRWEDVPAERAVEGLLGRGLPANYARGIVAAHATLVDHPETVDPTVEKLLGRPAIPFRDWAADHADDFRTPTVRELADEYVALSRQGRFTDPMMRRLYADDMVRVEPVDPAGPPVVMTDAEANANMLRFIAEHEVHGVEIDGPFTGDDRFGIRFAIDTTHRPTGTRATIVKMSLYTVRDAKIIREEVYYHAPPRS